MLFGDYWKSFPRRWKYSPRPSASGNISNYGEIIFNSHLNVSNYLYIGYGQVSQHTWINDAMKLTTDAFAHAPLHYADLTRHILHLVLRLHHL